MAISINKYYLEDYREFMLENVDIFFDMYNGPLEDIRDMFENEMYVDNNIADERRMSYEDLDRLREIQLEVLTYLEDTWMALNVPPEVLQEILESYENGDHEHYRDEAEYYAALMFEEMIDEEDDY